MWFKKKEKKVINWGAVLTDLKDYLTHKKVEVIKISEPWTLAKQRLDGGAKDRGADRALTEYKAHVVKVQNQWINPLQSVNSGFGNSQLSVYNYQNVNYYECYALAQDPLFNKIFNILSKTPFANGGHVADLEDKDTKTLDKAIKDFDIINIFVKALRSVYVCGGCLLYMDFEGADLTKPLDLKKMDLSTFKGFVHIDPINLCALEVNTSDPSRADYMKPKKWYVIGLGEVDASHFLKFEDNIPELVMRPMTLYFGFPLTLLIKQDVANSNLASQGLANLMNRFRYLYLKTDNTNFSTDAVTQFRERLEAMSLVQDNFGIYPLQNTEDMMQLTTSIQGMDSVCEFFYQIIASKTDITLSILLGKGAQGLSGTLEGERKNFYDRMRSEQEMVKPNLLKALGIIYGIVTDGKYHDFTDYIFNPLEQSDEKEKAENMRSYVEVANGLMQMGVKNDDVLNWLKQFRDFNLGNVEIDTDTEGLEDYGQGLPDLQQDLPAIENNSDKVGYVMREFERGDLKDSAGRTVTDRKQAQAIAISEAEHENK